MMTPSTPSRPSLHSMSSRICYNCWRSTHHIWRNYPEPQRSIEDKEILRVALKFPLLSDWQKLLESHGRQPHTDTMDRIKEEPDIDDRVASLFGLRKAKIVQRELISFDDDDDDDDDGKGYGKEVAEEIKQLRMDMEKRHADIKGAQYEMADSYAGVDVSLRKLVQIFSEKGKQAVKKENVNEADDTVTISKSQLATVLRNQKKLQEHVDAMVKQMTTLQLSSDGKKLGELVAVKDNNQQQPVDSPQPGSTKYILKGLEFRLHKLEEWQKNKSLRDEYSTKQAEKRTTDVDTRLKLIEHRINKVSEELGAQSKPTPPRPAVVQVASVQMEARLGVMYETTQCLSTQMAVALARLENLEARMHGLENGYTVGGFGYEAAAADEGKFRGVE